MTSSSSFSCPFPYHVPVLFLITLLSHFPNHFSALFLSLSDPTVPILFQFFRPAIRVLFLFSSYLFRPIPLSFLPYSPLFPALFPSPSRPILISFQPYSYLFPAQFPSLSGTVPISFLPYSLLLPGLSISLFSPILIYVRHSSISFLSYSYLFPAKFPSTSWPVPYQFPALFLSNPAQFPSISCPYSCPFLNEFSRIPHSPR